VPSSATNEMTVQVSYAEDHDRLDQLMAAYRQCKQTDFARAKEAFKEFKQGLQRHILWEESILFPLFEEKTGMRDCGPTVAMRAEHREIGRWLEACTRKFAPTTWRPTRKKMPCAGLCWRTIRRRKACSIRPSIVC